MGTLVHNGYIGHEGSWPSLTTISLAKKLADNIEIAA